MILTDNEILDSIKSGSIKIEPFDINCLSSNSYDVHLGSKLGMYVDQELDAKRYNKIELFDIPSDGFILQPNTLYLGVTSENTETHDAYPTISGKSSVGRLGISIHITAGNGDIGFCGHWTLEIFVIKPVRVYAGMPIGQLIWFQTSGKCINPYNMKNSSKYNNQPNHPVESMMWRNNF